MNFYFQYRQLFKIVHNPQHIYSPSEILINVNWTNMKTMEMRACMYNQFSKLPFCSKQFSHQLMSLIAKEIIIYLQINNGSILKWIMCVIVSDGK